MELLNSATRSERSQDRDEVMGLRFGRELLHLPGMEANLEVLFTPAEFSALTPQRFVRDGLRGVRCAAGHDFDDHGAGRRRGANLSCQRNCAGRWNCAGGIRALLAGERDGLRIRAAQTGGVDFDLGNSPREFTGVRRGGEGNYYDHDQWDAGIAGLRWVRGIFWPGRF